MDAKVGEKEFKKPDKVLVRPYGWSEYVPPLSPETQRLYISADELRVIVGLEKHEGLWWLHVSFSRADRLPSYDDLITVKNLFVGTQKKAIQVFPSEEEYVNIHPNCLHLWSPVDEDPLPDFTSKIGDSRAI